MKTFDYNRTGYKQFDAKCVKLIEKVNMNLGKMQIVQQSYPDLLASQNKIAVIDEVYFSTKIEGIMIDYEKVKNLVANVENKQFSETDNNTNHLTDFELQVEGYAKLFLTMCKRPEFFKVDTTSILAMFYSLFNIPANYKKSVYRKEDYQNVLNGNKIERIRVSPVSAFETPLYLGSAVASLADSFNNEKISRLLCISKFFVDFMCIMPFDAGVGRIARLYLQLLLFKSGIDISKYVSISKIFEDNAPKYYESIALCCEGWDEEKNNYNPFAIYLLESINKAYDKLFAKTNFNSGKKLKKAERIFQYFLNSKDPISKRDIINDHPDISVSTIENTLNKLKRERKIKQIAGGRSTKYILIT